MGRPPVVRSTEKSAAVLRVADLRAFPVGRDAYRSTGETERCQGHPAEVEGRLARTSQVRNTVCDLVFPVRLARRVEEAAFRTSVRVPVIRDPSAFEVHVIAIVAVPRRGDALQMA